MAASYQFIINTGTVVADTTDLKNDVFAEYRTALGQTIDLGAATPQGTLAQAEINARTGVMKNNADLANTINPDLSFGVYLDAICALLGIRRPQNISTQANGVTMNGTAGVTIAAHSRVKTSNGDIFYLANDYTIPGAGTGTTNFLSQQYGSIPLPLGNLTIVDGTIGWGSAVVTSGTAVVPGTVQLNDPQLKIKRNQQLAVQGVGASMAVASNISQVNNVNSQQVVENNTGSTATAINGVTFTLPNALWACVSGGADADVANAMYLSHQGGCPWDYGTSGEGVQVSPPNGVQVTDPVTNKKYYVKFVRPNMFDVYVQITVHQLTSVASPVNAVQNAILTYAQGLEQGEPGLVVGANISAYEMAGAVARQLPGMYVKACAVAWVPAGNAPPSSYVQEQLANPWQQGQLAIGNIQVTVV